MDKRTKYLQDIGRQSLNKFIRLVDKEKAVGEIELMKNDWNTFLNDEKIISTYDKCVRNFESLLGFSSELSKNLSVEELASRVAERFAEIDLAKHVIREYSLEQQNNTQLEKLLEKANTGKICDFRLQLLQDIVCFEAKYTSSISESSIKSIIKKALSQILETDQNVKLGVIWIFTYKFPENPQNFQTLVESIKTEFRNSTTLPFLLTVQTYLKGLFGDCTVRQ